MNRVFKSLALTLLAALLIGCGADPHTDTTATTQEEEILLPPAWTTPTNQYLTEDRTRFRVIGDTLYWDVQDPTDPSNNAEWLCHEIPFTEIIGSDSYTCPVRYRPLRMGYVDEDRQILYLAFDRPVRYADETHPDYFYVAHFLYLSKDGGRTWTPMASPTMSDRKDSLSEIRFHPSGVGYLSIWKYPGDCLDEIYITEDGGQSWTKPEPIDIPVVYFNARVTDMFCTLTETGAIRLTYEVGIYYGHQSGLVFSQWIYEKMPGEGVWTRLSEMPPVPVYPEGK